MSFQSPGSAGMSLISRLGPPSTVDPASNSYYSSPKTPSPNRKSSGGSAGGFSASPAGASLLSRLTPLRLVDRIEVRSGDLDFNGSGRPTYTQIVEQGTDWSMSEVVDENEIPDLGTATSSVYEINEEPPVQPNTPVLSSIQDAALVPVIADETGSPTSETAVDDLLHYSGSDVEMEVYQDAPSVNDAPAISAPVNLQSEPALKFIPDPADPLAADLVLQNLKLRDGFKDMHPEQVRDQINAVISEHCTDFSERAKEVAQQMSQLRVSKDQLNTKGRGDAEDVVGVQVKRARENSIEDNSRSKAIKQSESDCAGSVSRTDGEMPVVDESLTFKAQSVDKQLSTQDDSKDATHSHEVDSSTKHNTADRRTPEHTDHNIPRGLDDKITGSRRPRKNRIRYNKETNYDETLMMTEQAPDRHPDRRDSKGKAKDTWDHHDSPNQPIQQEHVDQSLSSSDTPPPPYAVHAEEGQLPSSSQTTVHSSEDAYPHTDYVPQSQSNIVNSLPVPLNVNTTLLSTTHINSHSPVPIPSSVSSDQTHTTLGQLPSLPVPGLWFAKMGLDCPHILEATFDVDPDTAMHWGLSDTDETDKPNVCLHLLCLPVNVVSSTYQTLTLPTTPEVIANAMWGIRPQWPSRGTLVVEVNSSQSWGQILLSRHLAPGRPHIDVTNNIRRGRNVIRFVQLRDMSQHVFVLHASEAESQPRNNIPRPSEGQGNPDMLDDYLEFVATTLNSNATADNGL